ncbi:MAG TPA: response regulator [Blastocatellia bacterium]|nr:response regulator [Blastocatellia bacterium]
MSSRVLLAIADPQLRRAATEALNAARIQNMSADDGTTAFNLLKTLPPDVLVAEIALPGKDGYALCQYVRQEPPLQSVPVVLLDNHFDAINRKIASRAGATVYLSQPFTSSELVEVVQRLLESKAAVSDVAPVPVEIATPEAEPLEIAAPEAAPEAEPPPVTLDRGRGEEATPSPVVTQARSAELALEPYTQSAALARRDTPAPPQPRSNFKYYVAALLIVLAGIAVAIWLRMRPAETLQAPPPIAATEPSPDDSRAAADQPDSSPAAEPAIGAEPGPEATPSVPGPEPSRPAPPASTSSAQAVRGEPPAIHRPPGSRPNVDARRQEPRPVGTAAPLRQGSLATPLRRPPDTPTARPPTVSSNTIGDQWRKGGHEMALVGEHFTSGVKHFGKGGGKAFLWLGRKIGSGLKRVGSAVRRAF